MNGLETVRANKNDSAKNSLYALQWLGFAMANLMVVPVIVGAALGLDSAATVSFAQRTLLFVGLFSYLQALLGHRYLIIEGPGAMWYSLFIIMALFSPHMGKPLPELRSDLVAGMLLSGITYLVLVATGLHRKIRQLFTPLVNGTFLVLLPLMLSGTIIKGILGGDIFNARGFVVALTTLIVTIVVSLKAKGFVQSISILCGIFAGWLLAALIGASPPLQFNRGLISLPAAFPWGTPTIDYGILLSCFITGILILSNHIASTYNMANVMDEELSDRRYARSLAVTGVGNMFAAVFGVTAFIPTASSVGFVKLTGVVERMPFFMCSIILVILGLFPVVGGLMASIPQQLGYAVLLIVFCQIFGLGLREYAKLSLDNKDVLVCGLSVLAGIGVMFLPADMFVFLHPSLRLIVSNGLIIGLLMCITLERIVK